MMTSSPRRVPAIVVTGFLGSGKTTVVRWLLECARRDGQRAAVVSNEFGALGVDQDLLRDGAQAIVQIDGGCVCCRLSDDLRDTLIRLKESVDPDLFLIETSGLALASETLLTFGREPVRDWIDDDIGIAVVDAEQVLAERDLEGTFEDQVTACDLIVLNKIDLVPASSLERIEQRLRQLEPDVPIVRVTQGRVDPKVLVPTFSSDQREQRRIAAARDVHHHDEFTSEILEIPAGSTRADIERTVRCPDAVRAKGFVASNEGLLLLQMVGPRLTLTPATSAPSELAGRVVRIRRAAARIGAAA